MSDAATLPGDTGTAARVARPRRRHRAMSAAQEALFFIVTAACALAGEALLVLNVTAILE